MSIITIYHLQLYILMDCFGYQIFIIYRTVGT